MHVPMRIRKENRFFLVLMRLLQNISSYILRPIFSRSYKDIILRGQRNKTLAIIY